MRFPQCFLLPAIAGALLGGAAAQDKPAPIPKDVNPLTTKSGLQWSVLKAGTGKAGAGKAEEEARHPKRGDKVTVHYTGWLASGKEFDCSRRRGAPATFAVGQVIEGWNEGLALMTPGARFKLTIPSKLGYGARGYPPTIPADATLVFDVELLSIEPAPDFRKPDAANAVKLDSDLVYEVLVPGAGEVPGVDVQLELAFTFWTAAGKLLHDSRNMGGTKWASANSLRLGVLVEAAKTMKPDEVWVCEVPPTLAFGDQKMGPDLPAGSTTIWRVKMVRTFVEPAFKLPDDGELKQTDSGLQYLMLREGKGRSPRMGESVTVHYAGWLTDGTPFDSSYARTSARFQLGGVIQGWNEGLQLMKPGGACLFVIPAVLAYGEAGSPPKIGPGATLVFHVELLEVGR